MAGELSIFADNAGTQPLTILDFEEVMVGNSKSMTVYIKNNSPKWPLRKIKALSSVIDGIDTQHPTDLAPGEIAAAVITWSPSLNIDEPLEADSFFEGELLIKRLV